MTELEKRKTLASKFAIAPDATATAPASAPANGTANGTANATANAPANATDQAPAQANAQASAQSPAQSSLSEKTNQTPASAPASASDEFDPEGTGEANYNTNSGAVAVAKDAPKDAYSREQAAVDATAKSVGVITKDLMTDVPTDEGEEVMRMRALGIDVKTSQEKQLEEIDRILSTTFATPKMQVKRTTNDINKAISNIYGGANISETAMALLSPLFEGEDDLIAVRASENFLKNNEFKLKNLEEFLQNPNIPIEDKKLFLNDIYPEFEKEMLASKRSAYKELVDNAKSARDTELVMKHGKINLLESQKLRGSAMVEVMKMREDYNKSETNSLQATATAVDLFVPLAEQANKQNYREFLSKKGVAVGTNFYDYFDAIFDMQNKVIKDPKALLNYVKANKEYIEGQANSGLLSSNNYLEMNEKLSNIEDLIFNGETVDPDGFESILFDISSVIDTTALALPVVGTVIGGTGKLVSGGINAVKNALKIGEQQGAVAETGELVKNLLMTDALRGISESKELTARTFLVDNPYLGNFTEKDLEVLEESYKASSYLATDREKQIAAEALENKLQRNYDGLASNFGYRAHVYTKATDAGITVDKIITKDNQAFETEAQAVIFNKQYLNGEGKVFQGEVGGYLIKMQELLPTNASIVKLGEGVVDEDEWSKVLFGPDYFNLSEVKMSEETLKRMVISEGRNAAYIEETNKILKPYFDAPKHVQEVVVDKLQKWADDGKQNLDYYRRELTPEAFNAFEAVWRNNAIQYVKSNASKRTSLITEGYLGIKLNTGIEGIPTNVNARPLASFAMTGVISKKPVRALNLDGSIANISEEMLDNGTVFKMDNPIRVDNKNVSHIYVPKDKTDVVGDIPLTVLPFNRLLPRLYDQNIFVEWVDETNEHFVVGAFQTTKEAEEYIAKAKQNFKDNNPGVEDLTDYVTRFDRSVSLSELKGFSEQIDVLENSGFFKSRGAGLESGGKTVSITDGNKVIRKAAQTYANHFSFTEAIEGEKIRFVNTFGRYLKADENGQIAYPLEITNEIFKSLTVDGEAIPLKAMKRMHESIAQLEGKRKGVFVDGFQRTLLTLTQQTWFREHPTIQKALFSLSKTDPTAQLRFLASAFYIRGNPFRQLFLQVTQAMYLLGAYPASYVSKENTGYLASITAGTSAEVGAKLSGLSVEDYKALKKIHESTGLASSVTAHSTLEAATTGYGRRLNDPSLSNTSNIIRNAGDKALMYLNKPLEIGGKIGFEAGERINLATQFVVAKDRLMELPEYKGKSYSELAKTASFTNDLIYEVRNQTHFQGLQVAKPRYSEGLVGTALQYTAVSHKAIVGILPEKFGGVTIGKQMDFRLRAAYMASSLGMYGLDGIGVLSVYDKLTEGRFGDDPSVQILRNGLLDYALNATLSSNADYSGTSYLGSPVSFMVELGMGILQSVHDGESWSNIVKKLEGASKMTAGDALGAPVVNVAKTFLGGFAEAVRIAQSPFTEVGEINDIAQSVMGGITPLTKQLIAGKISLNNNGFVDKNGNKLTDSYSVGDMVAQLLGISPKEVTTMYDSIEKKSTKEIEDIYVEDGKKIAKNAIVELTKYGNDPVGSEAFYNRLGEIYRLLPDTSTPEGSLVHKGFHSEFSKHFERTTKGGVKTQVEMFIKGEFNMKTKDVKEAATNLTLRINEAIIAKERNGEDADEEKILRDLVNEVVKSREGFFSDDFKVELKEGKI